MATGYYSSGSSGAAFFDGGRCLRDTQSLVNTTKPGVRCISPSSSGLTDLVLLIDLLRFGLKCFCLGCDSLRNTVLL